MIYVRTLLGIIDDYFDGYYSEEMIESQVFFCYMLGVVCRSLSFFLWSRPYVSLDFRCS